MWPRIHARPQRFLRFIISGGVNTGVSYTCYLALLSVTTYRVSYSFAYVIGMVTAYVLNRVFVFKSHRGAASVFLLPVIYVVQYGIGIGILWLWVDIAGLSQKLGPLAVIALTLPLTYLFTRLVFVNR